MENLDTTVVEEDCILYSEKFTYESYEYRCVTLPGYIACLVVPGVFISENEWRALGITMSPGWVHYGSPLNTPRILWFRRTLPQLNTPYVTDRKERRPRLMKSSGDLPGLKSSLPTVYSASTVLHMRRLVAPDPNGFETVVDLPLFNLSLKGSAAPTRTVTLRSSLQTREFLRL